MDDKRILWVTAAVGIFLLVVIGAALILYSPHNSTEPLISSAQTDNSTWLLSSSSGSMQNNQEQMGQVLPSDIQSSALQTTDSALQNQADVQNADGALPSETVQSRDVTVISENTTVIDLGASQTTAQSAAENNQSGTVEQNMGNSLSGTQPMNNVKTVVPVTVQAEATTTSRTNNTAVSSSGGTAKKPSNTASAKKTSGGAQSQTKTAKPNAKNTGAAKNASASAKSTKNGSQKIADRFWVQAASYTNKANAEHARSVLAGEKIPAEVFTYQDKGGTVYYRLRVGPYTTESEAEYWNSRIKLIDNFSSTKSYVTNSSKPAR